MAAIGAASSALPARARPKRRGSAPLHAVPATAPLPAGIVGRPAVVERLAAARAASLVLVVAPAGYGKTTVLREWDLTDSRQFAWWRLSAADDDPERFAESVTRARATLARNSEQVLILDDVHVLRRRETLELLGSLVDDLGEHGQLVLAGRARPGLPIARLRTERRLVEMNSPDLVLTRAESAAVASANGLELDEAGRELLAWRAEGWPAAVYLAAVALRDEPDTRAALAQFTGSDRLVSDYVRSELLAPLPRKLADFLQRACVLPRLSACACDYVLEREDSGCMLAELARTNVPLVPLDRSDTEYRLNRLFAEAL